MRKVTHLRATYAEGALMYEGRDHVLVSKHRLDRIALWLKSVKGKRSST